MPDLDRHLLAPLAALLLLATTPHLAQAQTGGVGIGTTTPAASAALEVRSTSKGLLLPRLSTAQRDALTASTTAPPVPGLLIYLTDGTPGLYAYDGAAWVRLGADNLGNHIATQTLDLNAQRLLGTVGNALGDSTAQVELNSSVGTQSTALITRSNFGAKYTRTMLSGYGKLPDGTTTANDYGIWATAYRGGAWAGFFSAGNTTTPLRWVGICQHPGYNNTGSAIRIVDGTQGAGKVLTSDAIGYGTWRTVPAPTAAGGNFNLGPYYLVGNGGSTGIAITSTGRVGINTTTPYSQLANTATNILGSDGVGGNPGSLAWAADQSGYAGMFYNANTAANATGLAVKIAATGTAAALDVSQGTTQDVAGTTLLRVLGNGNVGIGTPSPAARLTVQPDADAEVGLRVTNGVADGTATSGNIVLQTLTGGNSGYSFLGFNGYNAPAETRYNTGKNRWRLGTDQRSNTDAFFLDTWNGTTGTSVLTATTAGNVGIGMVPNAAYKLDVAGTLRVNGTVYTSDQRFKTNIRPLTSALSSVLALRGVRYEWNALGVRHGGTAGAGQVGLLAQEVEKIYPELVSTDAEGYKAVNYAQLTPVLIEALKEQQQQIEALKARAATAEARATATTEAFEARLRQLEAAGSGQARK